MPGHSLAQEQIADTNAANAQTVMRDIVSHGGVVTDAFGSLVANLKFDRQLDPEAKKYVVESTLLTADRMKQTRAFLDRIEKQNPGITTEQKVGMLNEYNDKAPPYNYETSKPLPENNKRLNEFTSPEALKQYVETGEYNPESKKESNPTAQPSQPSQSEEPSSGKIAASVKLIAKTLDLPETVTDAKTFQDWYSKQLPLVQKAAMLKWGGKK